MKTKECPTNIVSFLPTEAYKESFGTFTIGELTFNLRAIRDEDGKYTLIFSRTAADDPNADITTHKTEPMTQKEVEAFWIAFLIYPGAYLQLPAE